MKRRFFKKTGMVAGLLAMTIMATGCNRTYEASFDQNASEFIEIGNYMGIKVELDTQKITDDMIENQIKVNVDKYKTYVETDRASQADDVIVLDFFGSIGGKSVSEFSSEDYSYEVGSNDFIIEGFDEAVTGMKKGDFKIVTLKVPENFKEEESYAGANIVYEITCKSVTGPVYPQITDGWVKANLGYDTVEAYRDYVQRSIEGEIKAEILSKKTERVLTDIEKGITVKKVPEELINSTRERFKEVYTFYANMMNITLDEYCEKYLGRDFESYVEGNVYQQLILQLVVEKENITVDEYYYKDNLARFADAYGDTDDTASFVEEFGKDYIIKQMIIEKATNLIIESAVIK